MSKERDKLIEIIESLDADYQSGKLSEERYHYFRSRYLQKLNEMNKSRNRKRKPQNLRHTNKQPLNTNNEEQELIQKFILNPRKGDKPKKESKPMDSSTFGLSLVLVLVIAFTIGIGYGVFAFDFGEYTVGHAAGTVHDTTFPNIKEVTINKTNITYNQTYKYSNSSYHKNTTNGSYYVSYITLLDNPLYRVVL